MKKYIKKNIKLEEDSGDSADDFVQDKNWSSNLNNISENSDKLKKEFFENKKKLPEFLQECKIEKKEISDRLGFFDSKFGSIAVGYDKFKEKSPIAFSLMPKIDKNSKINSSKLDFKNKHNYFGKYFTGKKNDFKFNSISWEYNQKSGELKKIYNSSDKKIVDNNLLYENDLEKLNINNLEDKKKFVEPEKKFKIDKAVNKFEEIQKEKENDNLDIKQKIEDFIKKLKENKLKFFSDSEDLKIANSRISKKEIDILYIIKKRILEMINSGEIKNLNNIFEKINVPNKYKNYIKKYFNLN